MIKTMPNLTVGTISFINLWHGTTALFEDAWHLWSINKICNPKNLTNFTNPRMHLFHIPQCTIQNRNVHISVLNSALWDMEQVHSGICELGQLCAVILVFHHYFLPHHIQTTQPSSLGWPVIFYFEQHSYSVRSQFLFHILHIESYFFNVFITFLIPDVSAIK